MYTTPNHTTAVSGAQILGAAPQTLHRKPTLGNGRDAEHARPLSGVHPATSLLTSSGILQTKLTVGAVDDPYEREADAVADRVMSSPKQHVHKDVNGKSIAPEIQRKCASCEEEKVLRKPEHVFPHIQRKAQGGTATVSNGVNAGIAASRGSGQGLDQATRGDMETSFGRDFSSVKIHTGKEAAHLSQSLSAKAFTVGNDIYFNHGQYQPQSQSGRHLLAHELTHTVQQGAGDAGVVRRANLSGGDFGMELHEFSQIIAIPAQVFTRLAQSSTFMNMVRALDRHYIGYHNKAVPNNWAFAWDPTKDGVFTKGPFPGRRLFWFMHDNAGSSFSTASALENPLGWDMINIQQPSTQGEQEIGDWIEIIGHETTHAFNRVKGNASPSKTALDRVTAAITDEVKTRATESKIVDEVMKINPLKKYTKGTASTDPAQAQRDMFPSKLKRTYLEQFVLSERIAAAITKESLTGDQIEQHNAKIDAMPLGGYGSMRMQFPTMLLHYDKSAKLYDVFHSDYDELRFIQRILDARWTEYLQDGDDLDAKEDLLQMHAAAFFAGIASYAARPAVDTKY